MRKISRKFLDFVHIPFQESEIEKYGRDEVLRIRMVNYISLVTLLNMIPYTVLYLFLSPVLFKPAIFLLSFSSLVFLGIMVLNRRGNFKLSRFLVVILNPLTMGSTATWVFGTAPDFQTFLLVSAFIPLFLWPLSKLRELLFAVSFNLVLYIIIVFLPPLFNHLVDLPENYLSMFQSTNVLVCFAGAGLAIVFYMVLANRKAENLLVKTVELEKARRHQDLIYSVIAHDLRGPFNSLIGFSNLLHEKFEDFDNAQKKKSIQTIYEASKSLNILLENLLGWSKVQSGIHHINLQQVSLKSLIEESLALSVDNLNGKKIEIQNKIKDECFVRADSYMISTVIRNLLSNAIKFTSQEGIINISNSEQDGMVIICVADSGMGIPKEYLKNLFEMNSTFTNYGTDSEKGSGIGLKLCGEFIKANGGDIWVESELEKGSKFYFTLKMI